MFDDLTRKKLKKQLSSAAGMVTQVAEKGMDGGAQVTAQLRRGAAQMKDDFQQAKNLRQETEKIRAECARTIQASQERLAGVQYSLEQEQLYFKELIAQIERNQLFTYARFYHLLRGDFIKEEWTDVFCKGVERPGQQPAWKPDTSYFAQAAMSGAAAGAAAVGAVTAFGTAGTGTAVAALSGPAYVNALLAAMGGGSLASGGFGMAAGAAVLGSIVAAPMAAMAAIAMKRKIQYDHQSVQEWQQEVIHYVDEVNERCAVCRQCEARLREIHQEMYAFAGFFQDLLNMSAAVVQNQQVNMYMPLLDDAAAILLSFAQIQLLTAQNVFREDSKAELIGICQRASDCRSRFYAYFTACVPGDQQRMAASRQVDLVDVLDDLGQLILSMRAEVRSGFSRMDQTMQLLRKELLSGIRNVCQYQQEAAERLAVVAGNTDLAERLLFDLQEKIAAQLMQIPLSQEVDVYNREKSLLEDCFGSAWKKLSVKSQNFLITARVLFSWMTRMEDVLDYSGVCILIAKAVEDELHHRLYKGFLQYMQARYPFPEASAYWPPALYERLSDGSLQLLAEKNFTLGKIPYLCGLYKGKGQSLDAQALNQQRIFEYGRDLLFPGEASDESIRHFLRKIGQAADYTAKQYRNPAAHINALRHDDAQRCFDEFIYVNKRFVAIVRAFAN